MNDAKLKQGQYNSLKRRIIRMRDGIGLPKWPIKETNRLTKRLMGCPGEGINEIDLRVLVRWFNREVVGRSKENENTE